jgi:hypothetical protein
MVESDVDLFWFLSQHSAVLKLRKSREKKHQFRRTESNGGGVGKEFGMCIENTKKERYPPYSDGQFKENPFLT